MLSAFISKKNITNRLVNFAGFRLGIFVVAFVIVRLSYRHSYDFQQFGGHSGATLIVGFILFILGLLLAIWARLYLGKNWGMPMTKKQQPELVTTGPYSIIRHPIYSGILLAIIGTAIAISFYWLLIVAVSGTYFIYSATVEERNMTKEFPKVYPGYKAKTKMLIPFVL